MKKLFVNTQTQECGMYDPSDLDDNWIEAPNGTQAVYYLKAHGIFLYYKVQKGILKICTENNIWTDSILIVSEINNSLLTVHLWGTLQDFDL